MNESQPSTLVYRSEPYLDWWMLTLAGLVFIVLGTIWEQTGESWSWFVCTILVPSIIALSVTRQAVVDPQARIVTEKGYLFGHTHLGIRRLSFKEIAAIVYELRARDTDEWWVALRLQSGRKIWLRKFGVGHSGRPPRTAEEYAWRLHCDTDLQIQELNSQRQG